MSWIQQETQTKGILFHKFTLPWSMPCIRTTVTKLVTRCGCDQESEEPRSGWHKGLESNWDAKMGQDRGNEPIKVTQQRWKLSLWSQAYVQVLATQLDGCLIFKMRFNFSYLNNEMGIKMAISQKESKGRIYLRQLAYKNMHYAFAGLVYKEDVDLS